MDNRIFCRREDMTIFAVFAPKEWFALRRDGRLNDELKRRRESGTIIEVDREAAPVPAAPHFKPREGAMLMHNPTGVDARMVIMHAPYCPALEVAENPCVYTV